MFSSLILICLSTAPSHFVVLIALCITGLRAKCVNIVLLENGNVLLQQCNLVTCML